MSFIILFCITLSCNVNKQNINRASDLVELIQNSITEKTCSFELLKEVDKHFYLSSFKTDTADIHNL